MYAVDQDWEVVLVSKHAHGFCDAALGVLQDGLVQCTIAHVQGIGHRGRHHRRSACKYANNMLTSS